MSDQISMFEFLENLLPPDRQKLRRAIKTGTGFVGGKDRIRKNISLPKKEFVELLKKEYGIGGSSFENGWIGSTSMHFYICENGWENRKEYSWTQIADEILDMIKTNTY